MRNQSYEIDTNRREQVLLVPASELLLGRGGGVANDDGIGAVPVSRMPIGNT